jgi:hypothetical protein
MGLAPFEKATKALATFGESLGTVGAAVGVAAGAFNTLANAFRGPAAPGGVIDAEAHMLLEEIRASGDAHSQLARSWLVDHGIDPDAPYPVVHAMTHAILGAGAEGPQGGTGVVAPRAARKPVEPRPAPARSFGRLRE